MLYQIFLSPQVKRWAIITYKHGIREFPFPLKPYKAFRVAQCKRPQLVRLSLDFDPHFIFNSSGSAFLETIGSYNPTPF